MMLRGEEVEEGDLRWESYRPLTSQWIDEGENGHLRLSFVDQLDATRATLEAEVQALRPHLRAFPGTWENRPTCPSVDQVEKLRSLRSWEYVVDFGVAVQRDLREKEAWVAWWHERIRQKASGFSLSRLREMECHEAFERYIGVWVNGASEEVVLRYLVAAIPCFIVHEFKGLVAGVNEAEVMRQSSFLDGTAIAALLGDDNPYQLIARNQGILDSLPGTDDGHLFREPRVSPEAELRSSLSRLLAMAQARRLEREQQREQASAVHATLSAPSATTEVYGRDAGPSANSLVASAVPPAGTLGTPSAEANQYAAPALEMRVIEANRVPWIVPPPIEPGPQGKWDKYVLTDLNGSCAWVYQGKQRKEEYLNEWYDRKNRRKSCFGQFIVPPGVIDSRRFGAPVPRFPFFHPGDGSRARAKRASHWMYPSPKEDSGDAGLTARTPYAAHYRHYQTWRQVRGG
jgi:hypothetical protein